MTETLLKEIRDLLVEVRDLLKNRSPVDGVDSSISIQQPKAQSQDNWNNFLESKQPKNDYEIIALVVERLTSGGKLHVSKDEIRDFIRDNPDRIQNPEKINSEINNTKNMYKYIEYTNKKSKDLRLSIKGKQLVRQLPHCQNSIKKNKKRKR